MIHPGPSAKHWATEPDNIIEESHSFHAVYNLPLLFFYPRNAMSMWEKRKGTTSLYLNNLFFRVKGRYVKHRTIICKCTHNANMSPYRVHLILSTPYALWPRSCMPAGQNHLCLTVSAWAVACSYHWNSLLHKQRERETEREGKRHDNCIKWGNWIYMQRKPRELFVGFL